MKKTFAVQFLHGKAVIIDPKDNFSVLAYPTQEVDGIFFIGNYRKSIPKFDEN